MSAADHYRQGDRVRDTRDGRLGTVDWRTNAELQLEHPDLVPVQWDCDDAWLVNPIVLEPTAASVEPFRPELWCMAPAPDVERPDLKYGTYVCSLPPGHDGDHAAVSVGVELHRWPALITRVPWPVDVPPLPARRGPRFSQAGLASVRPAPLPPGRQDR